MPLDAPPTGPLAHWAALLTPSALAPLLRPPGAALPLPDRHELGEGAAQALADAVDRSRTLRSEPRPQPRASDVARYWQEGNRTAYEADLFASAHRLDLAALAAWADPTEAALAELLDGVIATCEQSTWCWPAHDDCHDRRGWVLPDLDRPYLDLGAGEQAARLAWIDALVGDRLEEAAPGVRARIRREVHRRVFAPFATRHDWKWLGEVEPANNWLAWICGNVLVAALVLEDDEAARADLVARSLSGIDRFLATIPPDGAIDEGFSYWWEGAARALEALDVLRHATSGALDAGGLDLVREMVAFPHRMQLGPEWTASFSDSSSRNAPGHDGRPWRLLHHWGRVTGDADAAAFASAAAAVTRLDLDAGPPLSGLGRLLPTLGDPDWFAARPEPAPLPARVWLPSTQVLLARGRTGSADGLTLLVKGGHDEESHNHLDVGAVSVALDGVPVVVDLGRATYTAVTFSSARYSEWHVHSDWHGVPAPRGAAQGVGREFAAHGVTADGDGAGLLLDLTACYPQGACERWLRHARLSIDDGGAGGTVEVRDDWQGAPGSRVPWVLAGEVELDGARALVRPIAGTRRLVISWACDAPVRAELTVRRLTDPYLRASWGESVTRLDLLCDASAATLTTTFRTIAGAG